MTEVLALSLEQSEKIAAALREVLDADIMVGPGMGWDGVNVQMRNDHQGEWYFDSTWAGDDDYATRGKMIAFYTIIDRVHPVPCDRVPEDAPSITDDPVTIARWIVDQINLGVPPENN